MSPGKAARGLLDRVGLGGGDARFAFGYFALFTIYAVTTPFLQVLLHGLGYGKTEIGLFLGLFEAAGIGGQLILGRVADRSGKYRPWLLLTALTSAAAALPLALLRSPWATIPAIAFLAFGVRGIVPVMDAAVVSHTSRAAPADGRGARKRGNYGLVRAVGTMGYIAMLGVTQVLHLEKGSPFEIGLWTAVAAFIFVAYLGFLPESGRGPHARGEARTAQRAPIDPRLLIGLLIIALGRLAMAPINSFFTLYATEVVKTDIASTLWAISAAAEIPALIIVGALVERFGAMRVHALSTLAIALRLAIYILWPTLPGVVLGQLLHFFCYGFFLPSAIAFVSSLVPPERRVWGMTLLTGVAVGTPSFLGSVLGGIVLDAGGYDLLFASAIGAAALSLGLYAVFARRLSR